MTHTILFQITVRNVTVNILARKSYHNMTRFSAFPHSQCKVTKKTNKSIILCYPSMILYDKSNHWLSGIAFVTSPIIHVYIWKTNDSYIFTFDKWMILIWKRYNAIFWIIVVPVDKDFCAKWEIHALYRMICKKRHWNLHLSYHR